MSNAQKKWLAAALLLAAVPVAAVLTLALFDWNSARPWIAARIKAETGRDLAIAGDLRVHPFSLHPQITAGHVLLGNAEWGAAAPMLAAEEVEFTVSLPELVRGRVVFPDVRLKSPAVLLQRDREGRRNWILRPSRQATAASPEIDRIRVADGQFEFRDAMTNTDLHLHVNTTGDELYGIAFSAGGLARGIAFNANGAGGELLTLLDNHTPYPLRVKATVGGTSINAEGLVYGIAALDTVDMRFEIAGKSLATLSDALHIVLPQTAPYRLAGRLEQRAGRWEFRRFQGTVGRSDLSGDFSVDTAGARPLLRGNLKSALLDIADLGGFVGIDPGAPAAAAPARVLPHSTFDLERLRRADAEIDLVAQRFADRAALPLDDLKAHLALRDGVARLNPLNFGVAGGNIQSTVWFDARGPRIDGRVDTAFRRLHINQLAPHAQILDSALGTIDGSASLAGSGNSVAAMLGDANGRVALVSAGGNISNLLLAVAGANGAKILKFLVLGDRAATLRCGAAAFSVTQGVMNSDVLVIDTSDTNITGTGSASLRDETLGLTLKPLPKSPSILSLRGPLHVTGTFANPVVGFDKPTMSLRAGGALLLGIANPLAALLPLLESGPGKDADCAQLTASLTTAAQPPRAAVNAPRADGEPAQRPGT